MELRNLTLRNYRVFESLDLEVPGGLVGIYGANGAGKSSLLEAMTWALYGRARTPKQGIATTGTTGECLVELGFDHDEHHYVIRRTISGMNHTVKARVTTAGAVVADGPTEVARYVRALLGMDEHAFRSSVFAEQKQLAAFSDHTADHRRRLVLSLLGITPIEKARDEARVDARAAEKDYSRLTAALPDTDELMAKDEEAKALVERLTEQVAKATTEHDTAVARRKALDAKVRASEDARREDAVIRANGKAARADRDAAVARLAELEKERADIESSRARIAELERVVTGFDDETVTARLATLTETVRRLEQVLGLQTKSTDAPDLAPDPSPVRQAEDRASSAAAALAAAKAAFQAATNAVNAAKKKLTAASALADGSPCPTCGQDIRGGATAVRDHFSGEHDEAVEAARTTSLAVEAAEEAVRQANAALAAQRKTFASAEAAWEKSRTHRVALEQARAALDAIGGSTSLIADDLRNEADDLRRRQRLVTDGRQELQRLAGRRERLTLLDKEKADASARLADADARRQSLRKALDGLAFDQTAHEVLLVEAATLERTADEALQTVRRLEGHLNAAVRDRAGISARIEQGNEQRARLGDLATRAIVLGRTAELLNGFRQAVVASVGPRLSTQASELFQLLTGGDYDGLRIDPETYEIQVIDQGVSYSTTRFSGSEVDLANLALRVAISEQVRFQAGGQIGLLVLDEALASLDGDRKDRMLAALTQLSARFRQILVVTHAVEVKEQLPNAIEVVKIGSRRSTARLVGTF